MLLRSYQVNCIVTYDLCGRLCPVSETLSLCHLWTGLWCVCRARRLWTVDLWICGVWSDVSVDLDGRRRGAAAGRGTHSNLSREFENKKLTTTLPRPSSNTSQRASGAWPLTRSRSSAPLPLRPLASRSIEAVTAASAGDTLGDALGEALGEERDSEEVVDSVEFSAAESSRLVHSPNGTSSYWSCARDEAGSSYLAPTCQKANQRGSSVRYGASGAEDGGWRCTMLGAARAGRGCVAAVGTEGIWLGVGALGVCLRVFVPTCVCVCCVCVCVCVSRISCVCMHAAGFSHERESGRASPVSIQMCRGGRASRRRCAAA